MAPNSIKFSIEAENYSAREFAVCDGSCYYSNCENSFWVLFYRDECRICCIEEQIIFKSASNNNEIIPYYDILKDREPSPEAMSLIRDMKLKKKTRYCKNGIEFFIRIHFYDNNTRMNNTNKEATHRTRAHLVIFMRHYTYIPGPAC